MTPTVTGSQTNIGILSQAMSAITTNCPTLLLLKMKALVDFDWKCWKKYINPVDRKYTCTAMTMHDE
jgi:hypothetical protein